MIVGVLIKDSPNPMPMQSFPRVFFLYLQNQHDLGAQGGGW